MQTCDIVKVKTKAEKSASFNGGNLFYGNDSKSKSNSKQNH